MQTVLSSNLETKKLPILKDYLKTILVTLFVALLLKTFVIDAYTIPSTSMENTLQVGDFILVNKLAYRLRTPKHIPITATSLPSFNIPLFRNVKRGDVIIFDSPITEPNQSKPEIFVKRCIGLPGDTVLIKNGEIYINGYKYKSPASCKTLASLNSEINYGPIYIPKSGDVIKLDSNSLMQWKHLIQKEGHTIQNNDTTIFIDGIPTPLYKIKKNYYFVLGDNRAKSLDSRHWGFLPEEHIIGEALIIYWSWNPELTIENQLKAIRWDRIGKIIR